MVTLFDSFNKEEKEKLRLLGNQHLKQVGTKQWFDYRMLNTVEATCLFYSSYLSIYKEYYTRIVDIEFNSNLTPQDLLNADLFNQVTQARLAADDIGCRYEFYVRNAFELFFNQGFRVLPEPVHLYSEEFYNDITRLWREHSASILQLATHPFYADPQYFDTPEQSAYRDYLISHVKGRSNKALLLAELVMKRILSKEIVTAVFGPEVAFLTIGHLSQE